MHSNKERAIMVAKALGHEAERVMEAYIRGGASEPLIRPARLMAETMLGGAHAAFSLMGDTNITYEEFQSVFNEGRVDYRESLRHSPALDAAPQVDDAGILALHRAMLAGSPFYRTTFYKHGATLTLGEADKIAHAHGTTLNEIIEDENLKVNADGCTVSTLDFIRALGY